MAAGTSGHEVFRSQDVVPTMSLLATKYLTDPRFVDGFAVFLHYCSRQGVCVCVCVHASTTMRFLRFHRVRVCAHAAVFFALCC